ncbi:BTB/POZ and MATH domain-containing protein 4-like [Miscanthus floridulus]|uniref:BTB/POZ and MATH domain-containing protein 4-like n=1 Tax=Miscanthus floridulus TaxID=154761 RepID=UPI003458B68C
MQQEMKIIAIVQKYIERSSGLNAEEVHCKSFRSLFCLPMASKRGYKRLFRRTALEASDFLKDDCLKINCTVGVVVSTIDYSRPHSIHVLDSDIGYDFGSLLDSQEGVDVILNVGGERFHAHKLVLAARSPVFNSLFFDDESDREKSEVTETDELKSSLLMIWSQRFSRQCFISSIEIPLLMIMNWVRQALMVLSSIL